MAGDCPPELWSFERQCAVLSDARPRTGSPETGILNSHDGDDASPVRAREKGKSFTFSLQRVLLPEPSEDGASGLVLAGPDAFRHGKIDRLMKRFCNKKQVLRGGRARE